jgi:GT2 family glycosyltransferase
MVVIGVPVDKDFTIDVRTAAYCSTESLCPDTKWGYVSSRDAGVGRSTIVHFALKDPKVTHVYFVDYDVVPPNGTLQKLLGYDLPIVAGIYPMTTNEPSWSFKIGDSWRSKTDPLPDNLTKATAIGGSTLLVKREVFEKLGQPCFKIVYREVDDNGRCYDEGEDEYFSRIAKEAGYKLMVDPMIICKHYNYQEI